MCCVGFKAQEGLYLWDGYTGIVRMQQNYFQYPIYITENGNYPENGFSKHNFSV